jgi:hypothetical protein
MTDLAIMSPDIFAASAVLMLEVVYGCDTIS